MRLFTFRNIAILILLFFSLQGLAQSDDEKYQNTIELADQYFSEGDYLNAKASYQYASKLKPSEQYPREKLRESMQLLRVQINKKADYNARVELGDELLANRSFEKAIEAYQEALKILPDKPYPTDQIAKCRQLQAEEAANKEEYKRIIAAADQYFNSDEFEQARNSYQEALALIPGDPYPEERIDEINTLVQELEDQQSAYEQAMSDAEASYLRKNYDDALESYKIAEELKPSEPLPKQKINELNSFLRKYEDYNKLVTDADNSYIAKDYEMSKLKYQAALEILPEENYPKGMITKIDGILEEKAIEAYANYDEWIIKADQLFNEEDYASAMIAYQKALSFKPNEEYATEKIGAINEIINYRKSQEEAYANSIAKADKLLADAAYADARTEYQKAAEIKPMEQYPMVKIDEIDVILAEIKNKEEIYDRIIAGADKLFNTGDYEEALVQYEKAAQLLPGRDYAPNQIIMINDILDRNRSITEAYERAIAAGDRFFSEKAYDNAKAEYMSAIDIKADEQYPKDRVTEINEILAQIRAMEEAYNQAIAKADQLLEQQDYENALAAYRQASEIKTDETYPDLKINEINALLAGIQAAEEAYNTSISKGDDLFASEDYIGAKSAYQEALALKPGEAYPSEQIAAIDAELEAIAAARALDERYQGYIDNADQFFESADYTSARAEYQKAADLKPVQQYPKDQLAEITRIFAEMEQLEQDYNNAIITGDQLFQDERYEEALAAYNRALEYKPGEAYPQSKVSETQRILDEIATSEALEESYRAAVAEADRLFSAEDYTAARLNYEEASRLKPEEQYPKDKVAEIEAIMTELARAEEEAKQKALDEKYNRILAEADKLFTDQDYISARSKYSESSELKPEVQYPKQQIAEIDRILAEERDKNYNLAISSGDEYFNAGDYLQAQQSYELALKIKPGESYPQRKISEAEVYIMAEREAKMEEYKAAIAEADKFFNQKIYDRAIDRYLEAFRLLPSEAYPMSQVNTIKKIINENAIVDINQEKMLIPDNTDKRFVFVPMPVSVRKENYLLIKARNPVEREFKMLVSYGSDGAKHGGFAVRIPEAEETNEFIIRIGSQYKWFSEENNWISIYPEGGDLEISLVRLSKSD